MEIETLSPKSYADFVTVLSKTFFTQAHGAWAFRGQSSTAHKLVPVVGRRSIEDAKLLSREKSYLGMFKRSSPIFLSERDQPKNSWEWLAFAQHHALPTRMLDWTRNPNVALFFVSAPM